MVETSQRNVFDRAWMIVAGLGLFAFVPAIWLGWSQIGLYKNPGLVAFVMILSASACTSAAGYAFWLSYSNDYEENALVSSALFCASLMVLTHGLLIPGVFYGPNPGVSVAGQLGGLAHLPGLGYLLWSRGRLRRGQQWRLVSVVTAGLSLFTSGLLLLANDVLKPLQKRSALTFTVLVIAVIIGVLAASHFADLARKFKQARLVGIAVGLIFSASIPVFFFFGGPYSSAYWWTHGICVVGTGLIAWMIWRQTSENVLITNIFASMLSEKPMQALEAYNSPRVMQILRTLDDPNDPRVTQALQSSRLLAEISQEKDVDPQTVLPTLKTMMESLGSPTS